MRGLIRTILRERGAIVGLTLLLTVAGLWALRVLNIEAYPDPSPPTIEVITLNPGWSAEEMERLVTIPLETQLNGMAGLEHLRSVSLMGLSDIKCYFGFDTDYWQDRQEVINRTQMATLPAGVVPQLSPTSAVGEIYRYQLVGPSWDLIDLKVVQDWLLERVFHQVPGVIDVTSFGGPTKEIHVDLDARKLVAFNVTAAQVIAALGNSNSNVGASYLDLGEQSTTVRGVGLFRSIDDIRKVAVATRGGTPVFIDQVGTVSIGARIPMGRVGRDGDGNVITGIVLMRKGEKSLPTLEAVRRKVDQLNRGGLPRGMKIVPYYDRTELIDITTETVTHTLLEGMVLVVFIVLAFLGDLRASLVVSLSIPLSLLFTFIALVLRGQSANLISMGAIDFGIIVDASVVMVENICRHLGESHAQDRPTANVVIEAAREVVSPIAFSSAIVVAAFLPLFTMQGVEGKIFGPMAQTYGFALTGALLLALTVSPVLASLVLRPSRGESEGAIVRPLRTAYRSLLAAVLSHPLRMLLAVGGVMALTAASFTLIGGEFMPKLEEGNLWVRAQMPSTISFTYACQLADRMRAVFQRRPEVVTVVSQLGRPDDGTDPTSYFNCEFFVPLRPRREWRPGLTKDRLVEELSEDLAQFPGVTFNFSQNIEDNVEEAMSGVKGENSVKLFGEDLETLERTANQIAATMHDIKGVEDLGVFAQLGQPHVVIRVDRESAARYGVLVGDVNAVVQAAIGGQAATQLYEGERRFDVVVRFAPEFRDSIAAIGELRVPTPDGGSVPLKQVARIRRETGASFIYREDNSRFIPIKFSVRGRDLQTTIARADAAIRKSVPLPSGYRYEWAGEFEELLEAVARLKVTVPVSVFLVTFLLYIAFHSLAEALLLLAVIQLAPAGGLWILLATGMPLSISAGVGFISVFGVSVLGGVILVTRIHQLRRDGHTLRWAVMMGSELQLRPVLMASLAAAIGLIPAALATGIGSETQKPLARVVVGGMVTSVVVILLVLPLAYELFHRLLDPYLEAPDPPAMPPGASTAQVSGPPAPSAAPEPPPGVPAAPKAPGHAPH